MATIAEKSADAATLLDDIASTMAGNADWSDADATIVNDGSTTDWWNNARVFTHADTGIYLLLYITTNANHEIDAGDQFRGELRGIRVIKSTGWDTSGGYSNSSAPAVPTGKTNVTSRDQESLLATVEETGGTDRTDSFSTENVADAHAHGIWFNRSGIARGEPVDYFLSAGDSWVTVAAWSTDTGDGMAGFFGWEQVLSGNKFFADGITPSEVMYNRQATRYYNADIYAHQCYPCNSYGFNEWYGEHDLRSSQNWHFPDHNYAGGVGARKGCVGQGKWGYTGPYPNDNTFYYRRPAVYKSGSQDVPVALLQSAVPAEEPFTMAHGDTVTLDSITYKAVKKYNPEAESDNRPNRRPVSALVRFE